MFIFLLNFLNIFFIKVVEHNFAQYFVLFPFVLTHEQNLLIDFCFFYFRTIRIIFHDFNLELLSALLRNILVSGYFNSISAIHMNAFIIIFIVVCLLAIFNRSIGRSYFLLSFNDNNHFFGLFLFLNSLG